MCRTLAAQADWVRADWEAAQGRPVTARLDAALAKGLLATQSPQNYPDAWQTLAETHPRLAQAQREPKLRKAAGQAAAQSLERALRRDPFLSHAYAALLKSAQSP